MSANSIQVGGNHYRNKAIQPWDFIASNKMGFLDGNVIKYLSRYPETRNIEDLKKASHYLQKLIETEESEPSRHCEVEVRVDQYLQTLIGMDALDAMDEQEEVEEIVEEPRAVKKAASKRRGRPPKAPWGYRANGKPYLRRPKNWKGD